MKIRVSGIDEKRDSISLGRIQPTKPLVVSGYTASVNVKVDGLGEMYKSNLKLTYEETEKVAAIFNEISKRIESEILEAEKKSFGDLFQINN